MANKRNVFILQNLGLFYVGTMHCNGAWRALIIRTLHYYLLIGLHAQPSCGTESGLVLYVRIALLTQYSKTPFPLLTPSYSLDCDSPTSGAEALLRVKCEGHHFLSYVDVLPRESVAHLFHRQTWNGGFP